MARGPALEGHDTVALLAAIIKTCNIKPDWTAVRAELGLQGVTTGAVAKRYERFLKRHNARFGSSPTKPSGGAVKTSAELRRESELEARRGGQYRHSVREFDNSQGYDNVMSKAREYVRSSWRQISAIIIINNPNTVSGKEVACTFEVFGWAPNALHPGRTIKLSTTR
ncbi:hypothetical protein EX30DRAFT_398874 [Ascodesmis nigricans]|uniref:Myb-like DNA-binding domain-containing protein n=1 Tax=Ascodesmis nigricans TaxID=341454 RepID=A0A4S2MR24_9PEZI|nr:hypothetical protein EX30DRAFT_398874 [Ascodesmis nigricans]